MSMAIQGGLTAQAVFAGGQGALFMPDTTGDWMTLAQTIVAEPASGALYASLGERALNKGYGLRLGRFARDTAEYRDAIVAGLKPRFDSALLDSANSRDDNWTIVSKFADNRFDAVDFGALAAAGLVTPNVARDYLRSVRSAAGYIVGDAQINAMLQNDRVWNGRMTYATISMGMAAILLLLGGGFAFAVAGAGEISKSAIAASSTGLICAAVSIFAHRFAKANRDSAYSAFADARDALVAVQRNKDFLETSEA